MAFVILVRSMSMGKTGHTACVVPVTLVYASEWLADQGMLVMS